MKNFWNMYGEILGDIFLILFGVMLFYIFIVIEIQGRYGQETNQFIRRLEVIMGIPIILLGINRLLKDLKR